MCTARPCCFMLLKQAVWRAFSRAWAKTGKRIAAKMAMIAITTSSSIRVKPERKTARFMVTSCFFGALAQERHSDFQRRSEAHRVSFPVQAHVPPGLAGRLLAPIREDKVSSAGPANRRLGEHPVGRAGGAGGSGACAWHRVGGEGRER